jgi:hypothetical protein
MNTNIILDCETISFEYNKICDLAWAVVQRNKVVTLKNYIVAEHMAVMATGNFSAPKMVATMQEVAKGNAIVAPWQEIMEDLYSDIQQANGIYAYNAAFDRNKIIETCKALQSPYTEVFESAEVYDKWRCLWAWATNTILYKKSFIDFCEAHGYVSEKGNHKTSAETCLRFIRKDTEYTEQHTARADVLDEFEIYLTIKKAVKREFSDAVPDSNDFKGTWHNIKRLNIAINS